MSGDVIHKKNIRSSRGSEMCVLNKPEGFSRSTFSEGNVRESDAKHVGNVPYGKVGPETDAQKADDNDDHLRQA